MTGEITLEAIQDGLISHAASLGVFDTTTDHPPAVIPGDGIWCIWEYSGQVPARTSGLASTSVVATWTATILATLTTEPGGDIDRGVIRATDALIRSLIGDFTLGGLVRAVDVRAMESDTGLTARAGYATTGGTTRVRVVTVTVPLIANDLYDETA